ncbi:MAG TPA: hypothetical protein VES67_19950 [Vicinamibacterales bacterium]|nr:hypothetical protein [Vicinamibacterales bacterium]
MAVFSRGKSGTAVKDQSASVVESLRTQLDRLSLDDELRTTVQEGLERCGDIEMKKLAADLEFALDRLPVAGAALNSPNDKPEPQIAKSIVLKGQIETSEDLLVDCQVDGNVSAKGHLWH